MSSYSGQKNTYGRPQGKGLRTYRDGETYEGDWNNDNRHGVGTFRFKSGDYYIGKSEN